MRRLHFPFLTLLLTALLLAPATLWAAKPPAENPLLSPEDPPEASFRQGSTRISSETGAALALHRLNYPVSASTWQDMARQYLAENFSRLRLASPLLSDL